MDKRDGIGIFSFFTGAGFLDLGFEDSGFTTLMANEIDHHFCEVYRYSRLKMGRPLPPMGLREHDVARFLTEGDEARTLAEGMERGSRNYRLVGFIGGPPCPDFSVAGKNVGRTGKHGRLSQLYIDMICRYRPDFFVFENVKGLWRTAKHRAFFDAIVKQVQSAGYATTNRLINALEYGAPQDRERIILVGVKKDLCGADAKEGQLVSFPWEGHLRYTMDEIRNASWPGTNVFAEGLARRMPSGVLQDLTVEHWFVRNDVEHHPNANDYFIPRAGLAKMRTFAEGDVSRKCYKRLHRWRFSPTAAYGNNEVHLHPYKARRLSVAETLAIQSLPKSYELPPDIPLTAKFKTIGNGVPYLAAKGIAETVRDYLERRCAE